MDLLSMEKAIKEFEGEELIDTDEKLESEIDTNQ